MLNGLEYTVSGVVDDVSGITADVYAEAWVTYSSLSVAMDHALVSLGLIHILREINDKFTMLRDACFHSKSLLKILFLYL